MPFLLRIILQRVLAFTYSVMVFVGIAPEISSTIPTDEQAQIATEERRDTIVSVLEESTSTRNIGDRIREVAFDAGRGISEIIEGARDALIDPSDVQDAGATTPHTETEGRAPSTSPTATPVVIQTVAPIIPTAPSPTSPTSPRSPISPTLQPSLPTLDEAVSEINKAVEDTKLTTSTSGKTNVRDIVVNTVCTRRNGNRINVSTGSGVLISDSGVILTNSHIAQFFLLEDYDDDFIDCAIFKETIPTFGYRAEVLYVSPEWIRQNSDLIQSTNPRGTGEDDYALLLINANTNPALTLPRSFPKANVITNVRLEKGDEVVAAGYPGAPTSILELTRSGKLRTAFLTVVDIFTFKNNRIDIFTTSASEVGARGSSGGGIFLGDSLEDADLIGIIVTTDSSNGNARINAITTSYINKDLIEDTGHDLNFFLTGDVSEKADDFRDENLKELAEKLLEEF